MQYNYILGSLKWVFAENLILDSANERLQKYPPAENKDDSESKG